MAVTRDDAQRCDLAQQQRSDASLLRTSDDVGNFRRAVLMMSFGFLGVFGGFQAAQGLQTSLNATLGSINLACLYGAFTLLCLLAPVLLAGLERLLGIPYVMLLTSLAYVAMVFSNVFDTPSTPCAAWAVPIAANALVGVAAPILWTAQNAYVCRCASAAAAACAACGDSGCNATSDMMTQFNSLFFSVYQFAGMCGNLLSSAILLALTGQAAAMRVLFLVLGCISAVGSAAFLRMPVVSDPGGASAEHPSALATARLAVGDARTGLLIPLMFTNGMTLAFFFGDYQAQVTSPVLGPALTGFTIATFFGANALATRYWGQAISRGRQSRRSVYVAATGLIASFLVALLVWQRPQNFERVPAPGTGWRCLTEASWLNYVLVLGLAALFALGDAFYESGPPATLQTFYAGTEQVVPAMANYKLWQSLGMAVSCVLLLDARVASLDATSSVSQPSAPAAATA
eukprot:TRINITY_DN17005_c0_g4_i2.p1 TRINITY_DN17005_c0_g4~~TRINITY_DN17005_c0_g4_i2.p1  ORF type:complete len:479 (-),score=89.36 TRINITY_DN17005_c0_g4_i2:129-1505(-)